MTTPLPIIIYTHTILDINFNLRYISAHTHKHTFLDLIVLVLCNICIYIVYFIFPHHSEMLVREHISNSHERS